MGIHSEQVDKSDMKDQGEDVPEPLSERTSFDEFNTPHRQEGLRVAEENLSIMQ